MPIAILYTNLVGWWLILTGSYQCYYIIYSHGLARSSDKLKPYLHYHDAYDYQIWQGCDFP